MKRLAALLALVLFLAALDHAALAQSDPPPVSPSPWADTELRARVEPGLLKQLASAGPQDHVPMIVVMREQAAPAQDRGAVARAAQVDSLRATAARSQAPVRAFLAGETAAGRAEAVQSFWIFNGLALRAAPATAAALAHRDDVELLRLDRYIQRLEPGAGSETSAPAALAWGVQRIQADRVWSAFNDTGTGVVVANMDTGVDFQHPALNAGYRGNVGKDLLQHTGNWFDATGDSMPYPYDANGHGTHTMGTMVGAGGIGVAPGARWIAVRVLDGQGYGYDSWIHAGFQWVLAPGGNPDLAPQVLNNSWSNANTMSTEFQADLVQLRRAGIFTVFSAGNNGPDPGSLGSPASLPGVFAVGALDSDNEVPGFSSRGPSPWGETKPQISAPGVNVPSSFPGGIYRLANGTSMAAPHVAGVAALVLAINPHLSVTATTYALTSTADALATPVPNNYSGWGRVNAYAAVQAVAGAGTFSGHVVDANSRLPLPGATVTVQRTSSPVPLSLVTGTDGTFNTGLAAGNYQVTAAQFGYIPAQPPQPAAVQIVTGTNTSLDLALAPVPVGVLRGVITDTVANQPATVMVSAFGTPIGQPAYGRYQLALPAGTYTIQARGLGYRVMTKTVTLSANHVTEQNFGLTPTDRILLVNTGAWYYHEYPSYYRQALDELGYTYDEWRVKHPPSDTPTLKDLRPYSLVLWSAPDDSPGFVGASDAITRYLTSGGKILLSGQDVAFWDGGGSGIFLAPYLHKYLMTDLEGDDAGTQSVHGIAGDIMAPLNFGIIGSAGANNQISPDVLSVADGDYAHGVLGYKNAGLAANKIGQCLTYRGLVFGFGLEGIDSAAGRRAVLQRALDYFVEPRLQAGLNLTRTSPQVQVAPGSSVVTFTVRARNLGESGLPITYTTAIEGSAWPAVVKPAQFVIAPCKATTLTLTVTIPSGLGLDRRNPLTLTVRSQSQPEVSRSVTLTAKTPAPILLVDHRRWYGEDDTYTHMLDRSGVGYDVWQLPQSGPPSAFYGPPVEQLKQYPLVAWFSGYDWYGPLIAYDELQLSSFLDGGGRLLLSSPFYLDQRGDSAFARDRLGVLAYTPRYTATATYGSPGHPLGANLGPIDLIDPFPSGGFPVLDGAMEPSAAAATAWRGDHDRAQAVARSSAGNRLAFWSLPLEALQPNRQSEVVGHAIGWLGPLGDSSVIVNPMVIRPGEVTTITLVVRDNLWPTTAWMTATLPAGLALATPNLAQDGLAFDSAAQTLTWHGSMQAGQGLTLTVPMRATSAGWLAGQVVWRDGTSGITYDQPLRIGVDQVNLATSVLSAPVVQSGQVVTVQMQIRNTGPVAAAEARVRGLVPFGLRVITGTAALAGPGLLQEEPGVVTWHGALAPGESATITYQIRTPQGEQTRAWPLEMLAWDGRGQSWEWRTWLQAQPWHAYFPMFMR
jgi:uncharacterized repeat protein (TIGR01451 family)